jgi:hypothetical protein
MPKFSIEQIAPIPSMPRFTSKSIGEHLTTFLARYGFSIAAAILVTTALSIPLIHLWRSFLARREKDPLYKYREALFHTKDSAVQLKTWDWLITETLEKKGLQNGRGEWLVPQKGVIEEVEKFLDDLRSARFTPKKKSLRVSNIGKRLYERLKGYTPTAFILFFCFTNHLIALDINNHLVKGNQASNWNERNVEWNKALQNLLESDAVDTFSGNKVAGFLYQQLQQPPLAILHLERAKLLSPSDPFVLNTLKEIRKKEGIPSPQKEALPIRLFSWISLGQWWTLALLSTLALALLLLFPHLLPKYNTKAIYAFAALSLSIFITIGVRDTLLPIKAIVLEPTYIYSTSQLEDPLDLPLIQAELVRVVGSNDQKTYQIVSSDGRFGYIPSRTIRPIRVPRR